MTMPKTAIATTTAADTNGAAPAFAVGLPPLTELPDPPQIPDMATQMPDLTRVYYILDGFYRARPDAVVIVNGYLAPDAGHVKGSLYPDCIVAFGLARPKKEVEEANGYTISEHGKPPDFVLEVASASTGRRDYTEKRNRYAALGVPEYWRFDRTGGDFHDAALGGDRLTPAGVYERLPIEQTPEGVYRGYSAALELELHWYEGRLRFWNPDINDYLPDFPELEARWLATADQRDAAVLDRDANAAQRDAEAAARQAAETQRDAEAVARQAAETQRDAETAARRVAEIERDDAIEERNDAIEERNAVFSQLDAAQQLIAQLQARLDQQQ